MLLLLVTGYRVIGLAVGGACAIRMALRRASVLSESQAAGAARA